MVHLCGNQNGSSYERAKTELLYNTAIPSLGIGKKLK
jgi:hypothetical protein